MGGVWGYHVYSRHTRAATLRIRGLQAAAGGDYASAVRLLEEYLYRYKPGDVTALRALAHVRPMLKTTDGRELAETVAILNQLLQIDPSLREERLELLGLYVKLNQRQEAMETADAVLQNDAGNVRALDIKSQLLVESERFREGLVVADKWVELDPRSFEAHFRQVVARQKLGYGIGDALGNVAQWQQCYTEDAAQCDLLRAMTYRLYDDRANSLLCLRRAAKRPVLDDHFCQMLVAQFIAVGDKGEDVAVLQSLVAGGAGPTVGAMLLSRLWETGQSKQIVELGEKMESSGGTQHLGVGAEAMVAMAYRNERDEVKAQEWKARVGERAGPAALAWTAILEQVPSKQMARELVVSGWREISEKCAAALAREPRDVYLRFFLGEALAAQGESDLALEQWQLVSETQHTWGLPAARMAGVLLDKGRLVAARQAATVAMERGAGAAGMRVVIRIAAALEEHQAVPREEMSRFLDRLDKAIPGDADIAMLRVVFQAQAGGRDETVAGIQRLLHLPQQASEPLLLRLASVSEGHQLGQEEEILATLRRLYGITPELAMHEAMVQAKSGKAVEGLRLFDGDWQACVAAASRPTTGFAASQPAGMPLAWQLARAGYLEAAGLPGARDAYLALCEQWPQDLAVQQAGMRSSALRDDRLARERMVSRIETILGGQSLAACMARARMLVETRRSEADDAAAIELLKRITVVHPAVAEAHRLWGLVCQRAGNLDEAIAQGRLVLQSDPESGSALLQLATLHYSRGEEDAARQLLDRFAAGATLRSASEVKSAAGLYEELGDGDKYRDLLGVLAERIVDDPLLQAEYFWRKGETEKAGALFADLLKKPRVEVIDLAAKFYLSQDNSDAVRDAFGILDSMNLPAGRAQLIRGDCYGAAGRQEDAVREYSLAKEAAPQDAATWKALAQYQFAIGRGGDAKATLGAVPAATMDAVLRDLQGAAEVVAVVSRVPELRRVVREYVYDPVNHPAALGIIQAAAKAAAGDGQAAVEQSLLLARQYPRLDSVQLWVLRVCLRNGRIREATALMDAALMAIPGSDAIAVTATQFYASREQWADALVAADHWRQMLNLRRNSSAQVQAAMVLADAAAARALVGIEQPGLALQRLKPFIQAAFQKPEENIEFLMTYADALVGARLDLRASQLLLPLAMRGGNFRNVCIEFAGTRLPPDEARQWLEGIGNSMQSPSADDLARLGDAWAALGARMDSGGSSLEQAAKLFDRIVEQPVAPVAALERAAIYAVTRQQPDKAIALYRRILAIDGKRGVALNNLAMLLADANQKRDEALRLAMSACEAEPRQPEFLDTVAMIKSRNGDVDGAIEVMRQAVAMAPEDARWRLALAEFLLAKGMREEAVNNVTAIETTCVDVSRLGSQPTERLLALRRKLGIGAEATTAPGPTKVVQ